MSRIIIATGADEAFALPLAVTLFSLAERLEPIQAADIYVLDGGLTARTRERLTRTVAATGRDIRLEFVRPNLSVLANMPVGRFGPMTYLRVLVPDSLPAEVSHAIYLDSDLLIQDSLASLWAEGCSGSAVAGVPDYSGPTVSDRTALPNWRELALPAEAPYINAGVLVMNLGWWRDESIGRLVLAHCERYRAVNRYADQDGINAVLCQSCKLVDLRYNVPAYLEFDALYRQIEPNSLTAVLAERRQELLASGAIIHFIGSRKPWRRGLASQTQSAWLAALARSGWFAGDRVGWLTTLLPIWLDYPQRRAVRFVRRLRARSQPSNKG